eukprot:g22877.t1
MLLGDPIRVSSPDMPRSILDAFNRRARQEPPILRMPSRKLREEVAITQATSCASSNGDERVPEDHVHNQRRIREVPLDSLVPTAASHQAAECQQTYGGSFVRGLCKNWMRNSCHWGDECKYVHLQETPRNGCPLPDGLAEACAISDAELKDALWKNMKKGHLRTPLLELLDSLRKKRDDQEIFQMLQDEIRKENLVLLVAASSAEKAYYWQNEVLQHVASAIHDSEVCVLVSPVLRKPPASLMECLMAHCRQELLSPSYLHLRRVCFSCFALRIQSDGITKLAKYVGYFVNRPDHTKQKIVVAHFRRQTEEPEELRIQEVLRNLLMAKALGRGQGRRHALRKSILGLLWRHPRLRGKISHVCRAGSVALALDTSSSDHDIILCLKDGGVNMVEELHQVILDLKKTCHRERLRRAEVVKKDFAVEIKNFYRHVDFDLVPVTLVEGHTGEQQWDVQRQALKNSIQLMSQVCDGEKAEADANVQDLVDLLRQIFGCQPGQPLLCRNTSSK